MISIDDALKLAGWAGKFPDGARVFFASTSDWGRPGDDKTSWWVVNPDVGSRAQGFRGTGPMLNFRRNAAGVFELP